MKDLDLAEKKAKFFLSSAEIHMKALETQKELIALYTELCPCTYIDERARTLFKENLLSLAKLMADSIALAK